MSTAILKKSEGSGDKTGHKGIASIQQIGQKECKHP
jgi:hypothetical protein